MSGASHPPRERAANKDALMQLFFALGQHSALDAIQEILEDGEHVFAFHDDIHTTSSLNRVGSVFALLQEHLYGHSRIRMEGKRRCGIKLESRRMHATFWSASPRSSIVCRGVLVKKIEDRRTPLFADLQNRRTTLFADLQASRLLLLHCAAVKANNLLRVVEPGAATQHTSNHDEGSWNCLCAIVQVDSVHTWAQQPCLWSGEGLDCAPQCEQGHPHLGGFVGHDSCSSQGSGFSVRGCSGARCWKSVSAGSS